MRSYPGSAAFFLSDFGVYDVEIVGPQVGGQLRKQAMLATIYSLAGMLVYLGFRFEWIYGVAAVVTVFHDTSDYRRRLFADQDGYHADRDCGHP